MDNVNDITHVPLPSQRKNLKDKRRIGLGVLGYGSALLMARVKYGSPRALKMTEELMSFFTNEAYRASALLAKEKGAFPLYDEEEYLKSEFVKQLDDETITLIKKYGMRNSHVTSIQPTGNSSCFANLVSGGLEPLFMHGYVRTSIQPTCPEKVSIPENVDWKKKTFDLKGDHDWLMPDWKWVKEGDENLLAASFNDKTWKLDSHRGLTKEEWIEDYGVSALKALDKWDDTAQWSSCTMELGVDAHVNTMSIFAKWVDSAISKTINLPNDYPYEDFQSVYIKAWENGIKGFTTYRAGTMTSVLAAESSLEEDKDRIRKTTAPERERELPCDVYHIKVKGEEYFVLVGLYNGDPYEVFAGKNGFIDKKVSNGTIIKLGRPKGVYKAVLDNGLELSPINATCSAEEDALTRMTSTALRHGADMHLIVQQLEKVKGDMTCFAKSMARAIKKYIPDGAKEGGVCPKCEAKDSLIRQEGCVVCIQCGDSKCA
jgi:ribonucleoside-diphosphate reductase alpha chain